MDPAEPPVVGRPASAVGWLVAERIARGALSVVVLGAVTRSLGPAGFGTLNAALALVGAILPLAQLGLDGFILRDLVRLPGRTGEILGTAAALRLAAGGLMIAGLTPWLLRSDATLPPSVLGPVLLLLLWQVGDVVELWFRRLQLGRPIAFARLVVVLLGAAAKLVAAARGADVVVFACIYSGEILAFALLLTLLCLRSNQRPGRWHWNGDFARAWLREGWGFILAAGIGSIAFRCDQLAVTHYLGDTAAGHYFAALRLLELPAFVASAIGTALLPALTTASTRDHAGEQLRLSFEGMAAVAWLTVIGCAAVGPWVIRALMGATYLPAVPVLIIYSVGNLALYTGIVRAQYLVLHPSPATQLWLAVATFVGQAGGSVLLVPRYGLPGGALAFAGTQVFTGLLLPLAFPALRPCLGPQARALLLPLQPARWPRVWAAFH